MILHVHIHVHCFNCHVHTSLSTVQEHAFYVAFIIQAIVLLMITLHVCAEESLVYNHDFFLYQTERPAFEKEATKNLQEENNELHQQVSLLSQWNDKHQKTITSLETQMDGLEEEKRQILVELMKIQSFEQVHNICT